MGAVAGSPLSRRADGKPRPFRNARCRSDRARYPRARYHHRDDDPQSRPGAPAGRRRDLPACRNCRGTDGGCAVFLDAALVAGDGFPRIGAFMSLAPILKLAAILLLLAVLPARAADDFIVVAST